MAYNDYEVITYKILKYLYDCLKEDDDIERIRLTREYYDVPRKYWEFILCNLIECGFVSGIIASNTKDGYVFSDLTDAEITVKGITYLRFMTR